MSSNRSTAASTHHHYLLAQHATNGATFRFCGDFAARSAYRALGVLLVAVIKTKSSSTSNAAKVCLFRRNAALAFRVFGSIMISELTKSEEVRVFRRLVPMIGLVAAWGIVVAAAPAQAQVNIDQGKSPAEIFSGDCGTCHKTAKGLANGRNSRRARGLPARALYVKRPAGLVACGLRSWRRLWTCAHGQSEARDGRRAEARRGEAWR